MNTNFLTLYLDAPMQSWGYSSKFERRTTLSYPTRSAIIGMICAAMGIPKEAESELQIFLTLKFTIISLTNHLRITDFHTVGGGYDNKSKDPFIIQSIPKTADGKINKGAVLTYREYLTDAKFGIIIEGEKIILEKIYHALNNPKWGVWLGRKSCIPTAQIAHGISFSFEEAKNRLQEIYSQLYNRDCQINLIVTETEDFKEGNFSLMDIPINFLERKFSLRRVKEE